MDQSEPQDRFSGPIDSEWGGIGVSAPRREDRALLLGQARFFAERHQAGQWHVAFVRSPHAHARITRINTTEALAQPKVRAVLTGEMLHEIGFGQMPVRNRPKRRDGQLAEGPRYHALARDIVRFSGEAVAMVIAETPENAEFAAEMVDVDYQPLPTTIDPFEAAQDGAPDLGGPHGNVVHDWEWGEAERVEASFAQATHHIKLRIVQNRINGAALEPRGALAVPDGGSDGRLTLYTPTQGVGAVRTALALALSRSEDSIRIVTDQVGGGFGLKNDLYPEQLALSIAALHLNMPLRWYASRSETFLADYQGRDHIFDGELALDEHGAMLAIRCSVLSNVGAYPSAAGLTIPTSGGGRLITNLYRIPIFYLQTQCVITNTPPIAAYRGAGKPEFCHLVERLVDEAARISGIDRVELRRRNLILPEEQPFRTPTGMVYDSGDYSAAMHLALDVADYANFESRRATARKHNRVRGIGFSVYSEPDGFLDNRVTLRFEANGRLTLITTATSNGQGHETSLAQIAASRLCLSSDMIDVLQGDSDLVGSGTGTSGSRTMTVSGGAIWRSGKELINRARYQAAHMLHTELDHISFDRGVFRQSSTNRSVDWHDVVSASFDQTTLAPKSQIGLTATYHYKAQAYNFPTGAHVCEVDIDPDTGKLTILRYSMIGDFGTIVNPTLLEGQMQGGVAQGIGQAVLEHCVYDPENGQLLTGSFMDYGIPRADDLPDLVLKTVSTPTLTNPLGVKGVGEAGCTASLPAVMNAVVDALASVGGEPVDMPLLPEKLWRSLRRAEIS